jgi:nicotinate-nucleotide adenylyltransferase
VTRIGVFGGQFDPPHNGHVAVAAAAIAQLGLDRLVVVVDADPPHRAASELAADVRGRLAEAAFAGLPGAEVRVLEASDSPFAVDTLRSLDGAGELFLIVGADQLARLEQWHDPLGVRRLATIVVAPRDDIDSTATGACALDMEPVDLSSSEIRSSLYRHADVADRLPPAVFTLVTAQHIYE